MIGAAEGSNHGDTETPRRTNAEEGRKGGRDRGRLSIRRRSHLARDEDLADREAHPLLHHPIAQKKK